MGFFLIIRVVAENHQLDAKTVLAVGKEAAFHHSKACPPWPRNPVIYAKSTTSPADWTTLA